MPQVPSSKSLYIGVMSGTSVDGIDAVLCEFVEGKVNLLASHSQEFPEDLKADILQLLKTFNVHLAKLGEIDHRLGLCYADCIETLINKSKVDRKDIAAIGCHGQTVFHQPQGQYPFTMQIGDGNIIAAKTGIKTIVDFRRLDMANGGQGAPLTPAFHQYFLNSDSEKRVILNLGGIANITVLAENDSDVIGFDTGPANCLIDLWIQKVKSLKYDKDGNWARSGRINESLLQSMLSDEYFSQNAPKSTGKELFNIDWIEYHLKNIKGVESADVQATLTELTARTVATQILKYQVNVDCVYVCGGGAYNKYLLESILQNLGRGKVLTTDVLGIPVQWVEAIAFAWLAMRRNTNQFGNLPSVTGAKRQTVLGGIY